MLYIAWDALAVKTNKGFLSLTPLSLWELCVCSCLRQVWSWPSLAPDATWLELRRHARRVVGTCQGSGRGLALTLEVSMFTERRRASNNQPWLTLIPHQSAMKFRNGRLMLALLWTLSPGMIKGAMLGDWVKLGFISAAPFILSDYVIKAYGN